MSNEPTFASALDRHLFPYIEAITKPLDEGPDDCYMTKIDAGDDVMTVAMTLVKETVFYVSLESKDGKLGELVYQRIDDRTHICRAGDWMHVVLDHGLKAMADEARETLTEEINKARERAIAFQPIGRLGAVADSVP